MFEKEGFQVTVAVFLAHRINAGSFVMIRYFMSGRGRGRRAETLAPISILGRDMGKRCARHDLIGKHARPLSVSA